MPPLHHLLASELDERGPLRPFALSEAMASAILEALSHAPNDTTYTFEAFDRWLDLAVRAYGLPANLRNPWGSVVHEDRPLNRLADAIRLAGRAHHGQVDKGGHPYILHPLRVMGSVETVEEKWTAVLHDVLEDSDLTPDDLRTQEVPERVLVALEAITKRRGESRLDAARRAALDPIARAVKIADVSDNLDLRRISDPTPTDYARQTEYREVLAILRTT